MCGFIFAAGHVDFQPFNNYLAAEGNVSILADVCMVEWFDAIVIVML